ncbi:MAG TPA: hypothetical protein GXX18_05635 [Bacillales bacterium]|nr:hypothetical protein [Bacillales bacterium]
MSKSSIMLVFALFISLYFLLSFAMFPYEMAWAEGTTTFDMFVSYIKMGVLKGEITFKSIISLIISLIVAYLFQKVISKIKTLSY